MLTGRVCAGNELGIGEACLGRVLDEQRPKYGDEYETSDEVGGNNMCESLMGESQVLLSASEGHARPGWLHRTIRDPRCLQWQQSNILQQCARRHILC